MSNLPEGAYVQSEERNLSYCVTLSEKGAQSKRSNYLGDFLVLAGQASIAWIDIKVEDLQKEAQDVATKFGFSQEIIKQMLARSFSGVGFQGGYYDFDTELSLLFPAISVKGFDVTIKPLFLLLKGGLILTIRNKEAHIFQQSPPLLRKLT